MMAIARSCVLLLLVSLSAAPARADYTACASSSGNRIFGHREMTDMNVSTEFVSSAITVYDRAWRGWWDPDPGNYAIWANWSTGRSSGFCRMGSYDGTSCLRRATYIRFGTSFNGYTWAFTLPLSHNIVEVDIADSPTVNGALQHVGTCAAGLATEDGTYVHELGHGYGYDHFDDWLSTMNTAQPDTTGCEPVGGFRRVRPSPQGLQCHDQMYGVENTMVDVTATPLRRTCPLTGAGCASPQVYSANVPGGDTYELLYVEFTGLNQHFQDLSDYVEVRFWLSRDTILTADDVSVHAIQWTDPLQGETRTLWALFAVNPAVQMPVAGVPYCVLVEVNSDGYFADWNPGNNVANTRVCLTRG